MEAPLLLSYCAGMYHFMRWIEGSRQPRLHSFAVSLAFVLGFMTKFVAALFLPMICAVASVMIPVARARFLARWRDWTWPALTAALLTAPWFVYESMIFGRFFWDVILGAHIVTRFTSSLDPTHLEPWYFYFTRTWDEFNGYQFASAVALVALIVTAWRGQPWQMRLLLVWWLLPLTLMSLGTSKLFHYAYPFLPPIPLAVGWLASTVMDLARGPWESFMADRFRRPAPGGAARYQFLRAAALFLAVIAIALAVASAIYGQIVWTIGGVKLLQNSTVIRPLLIAALLTTLAGKTSVASRTLGAVLLILVLPVLTYTGRLNPVTTVDSRLRTIRWCVRSVHESDRSAAVGVLNADRSHANHSDYYYLFRVGPWLEPETIDVETVQRRLFAPGEQIPVRVTRATYPVWQQQFSSDSPARHLPPGVVVGDSVFLFPGPYSPCAAAAAGAVSDRLVPLDQRRP
jgi:hypothetical protein